VVHDVLMLVSIVHEVEEGLRKEGVCKDGQHIHIGPYRYARVARPLNDGGELLPFWFLNGYPGIVLGQNKGPGDNIDGTFQSR